MYKKLAKIEYTHTDCVWTTNYHGAGTNQESPYNKPDIVIEDLKNNICYLLLSLLHQKDMSLWIS